MQLPSQTSEIFKILSKGQFISSNSSLKSMRTLYEIIDDEVNFERLHEYFSHIHFILERGDEYFYFSRNENKVDLENKLRAAFRWIDILDFLKTYDNIFGVGYRFSVSDIMVRIKTDAALESKLEGLKRHADKEKHQEIIEKILKKLSDESFIELENELSGQYKVLAAFKYLEQLILTINIPEEIKHEIPK
ncbi:MAG: hypothetical protein LAT68_10570 [Cyclobacteriaceae bacterium]|nr:hypothetical protein [Cyclobacteriaceae bacterium]MCH8516759.1 hypothetical protein [Cyclobacteriaceae bacterium]